MVNIHDNQLFVSHLRSFRKYDVRNAIRDATDCLYKDVDTWSSIISFIPRCSLEERERILQKLPSSSTSFQPYPLSNPSQPPPFQQPFTTTNAMATDSSTLPISQGAIEPPEDLSDTPLCPPNYLRVASQDTINRCILDFISGTSNDAMKQSVCISCGQMLFHRDQTEVMLRDLPNRHHLVPNPDLKHPAQQLTTGMLLAFPVANLESIVTVCDECLSRLNRDRIPRFSLANGLWVGEIPAQLQNLTLPERLLISLYFPAVYVVKLYPSGRRSTNWDQNRLNSGLKGNVSTYKLDQQQIADMVGLTMPPPVTILSATIAITYVGVNNLPKAWLPGTFRVRRAKVESALVWLKENNPLYGQIIISSARLNQLPQNQVPDQVLATVRWSTEVEKLDDEHGSYVPLDDDVVADMDEDAELEALADDDPMIVEGPADDEDVSNTVDQPPAVIPMKAHGVVDVAGHDIPDDQLFAHALTNAANVNSKPPGGDYMIRHGSAFVNEYARKDPVTGLRHDGGPDNPNHLLGSFPYLFPYGRGGFETEQMVPVSYESHARWAIRYHDGRFRKDFHFVFQVFGVIQKRQVCRAAALQVKKISPAVHSQLRSITVQDLIQASREETQKVPFSNPAIRHLRSHMTAIRSRVMGTDESRHGLRGKVWGTNLELNNPCLWITVNLPDTHDPTAQVLAGADIDLNAFLKTAGPDAIQRAINIAADPYAAALFFNYTVNLIFETLFGIKAGVPGKRIRRREGLFGTVQSYLASVEAQGRGTLHVHILLWSADSPSPSVVRQLLQQSSFRDRLRDFIRANIHANIEDKTTDEVLAIKIDKEASYSRPLHPNMPDYETQQAQATRTLARSLQYHKCRDRVCRIVKNGRVVCKRRAPFTLASDAWVSEDGQWGPKRICGFLNTWQPTLLTTLRCNHDIKLMTAGGATRNVTWYITNYASKKQGNSHNSSALLAQRFAYHMHQETRDPRPLDLNKRLLQRCANALGRDREFSAPEVMNYLMGWGDRFESHFYVTIRWDLAMKALFRAFPGLPTSEFKPSSSQGAGGSSLRGDEIVDPLDVTDEESYIVQFTGDSLEVKNQLREYAYRGSDLEPLSYYRFMLDTYDSPYEGPDEDDVITQYNSQSFTPQRRRPRHNRIPYLEGFGDAKRCRITRAEWHETMPRIAGRWFPRNNDPRVYETYCAAMLMLLKPWRSLEDLKRSEESFATAFATFKSSAPQWVERILENIQFYYDCADHASATVCEDENSMTYRGVLEEDVREMADSGTIVPQVIDPLEGLTQEDVEVARAHKLTHREQQYVTAGLLIAAAAGFTAPVSQSVMKEAPNRKANSEQLQQALDWAVALKAITREGGTLVNACVSYEDTIQAAVVNGFPQEAVAGSVIDVPKGKAVPTPPALRAILNAEQRRAHDIIVRCMENEVEGKHQQQLLMIVHGQGGTGKSLLIQAITESLKAQGYDKYLGKTATSGIAASPIGGNTVHHYFGIGISPRGRDWVSKASDEIKDRRLRNIGEKHIIFIDEMSMLTKTLLARVSEVCQVVRSHSATSTGNSTLPFGGLHVVLFGDFHQFPPVAGEGSALYCNRPGSDTERAAIGRSLFQQFETVVILRQQRRSRDPGWTSLLNRLRVGECHDEDLAQLQKLVLSDDACDVPDFGSRDWKDVVLITPRHSMRKEWNRIALEKHCLETGQLRYIIRAEDEDKVTGNKPRLDYQVAIARMEEKNTGRLEETVELAKGMKTMVMTNIATEADVANGTRGTIEDFWLHPQEEPTVQDDGSVQLNFLPPVLFFKPLEPTELEFDGVPKGLIPITPSTTTFEATNAMGEKRKIKRQQYALTGAYAFTDYKSQGQTIEKVIIDIAQPPSGKGLSPFNAYVALSRGRGRDSIRLLRNFEEQLFTVHPSEELRLEMKRLEILDARTKDEFEQWCGRVDMES